MLLCLALRIQKQTRHSPDPVETLILRGEFTKRGSGRAVQSTEEAHDYTWEQRSLKPWEAYNKLSMDAARRVGGIRTLTHASLSVNRKGRAGFGRRVVLYSRILSQLLVSSPLQIPGTELLRHRPLIYTHPRFSPSC